MTRKQEGFTMVELLISMVIFVLTIAAASQIFVAILTQFKQQSKVTETQVEGIVGLETLRRDIEQAGYGLPWNIPTGVAYSEASSPADVYNDLPPNAPRAIISGNGAVSNAVIGTSDYLVLKSAIIGTNIAAPKWTYIVGKGGGLNGVVKCWNAACNSPDDFSATDRVIALIPSRGSSETSQRILVSSGATFSVQFGVAGIGVAGTFSPVLLYDKYLIYGVESDTSLGALRMPYNRADYYVTRTGLNIPPRCAPNTGVLVKALISHGGSVTAGDLRPGIPLMDCVADMEVVYGYDLNNTGAMTYTDDLSSIIPGAYTGQTIRDTVKEVRVYILSHEGQRDATYVHQNNTILVGDNIGFGRNFDLSVIPDWQRYRWKVYSMIVQTRNLR